jgi:hypothetical protein
VDKVNRRNQPPLFILQDSPLATTNKNTPQAVGYLPCLT